MWRWSWIVSSWTFDHSVRSMQNKSFQWFRFVLLRFSIVYLCFWNYFDSNKISFLFFIIIMNISPHKLIQEPQMRSCSSHLSNKNLLSSFRNESKLNDGSFILDVFIFFQNHSNVILVFSVKESGKFQGTIDVNWCELAWIQLWIFLSDITTNHVWQSLEHLICLFDDHFQIVLQPGSLYVLSGNIIHTVIKYYLELHSIMLSPNLQLALHLKVFCSKDLDIDT